MLTLRSVLVCSALVIAAPAFAASDPVTQTTRDQRMQEAYSDFQSGKSTQSAPPPAAKSTGSKHHKAK